MGEILVQGLGRTTGPSMQRGEIWHRGSEMYEMGHSGVLVAKGHLGSPRELNRRNIGAVYHCACVHVRHLRSAATHRGVGFRV